MGVDNETTPNYVNIVIDDNSKLLQAMRNRAEEDGQNDEDLKKLSLVDDMFSFDNDEYYYEVNDNEIVFSGSLSSPDGDGYISINLPLSDELLIDILQGAIKRLNKLKVAMEALK